MLFFLTLQESAARQRILQAAKLCVCIAAEGLDGSFPFSSPFFLRLRSKNLLSQERKKRDLHQQHQRNADGKLLFSCLVMEQVYRQQCSCRTADCGQGKKRRDTDSPFSMHSVSFIDAIDCYGDHINTDQIQVQSCL